MALRILNYYPLFLPFRGGIETNISSFARYSRHEHYVLTDLLPGTKTHETIGACRVIRVRPSRLLFPESVSVADALLDLPRELVKMLVLRDIDYDLLHLRYCYIAPRLLTSLDNRIGSSVFKRIGAWRIAGKPIVVTFHVLPSHAAIPVTAQESWHGTEKDICRHAKSIICVDECMVHPLSQVSGGKQVFLIPSGIDTNRFRPLDQEYCLNRLPTNVAEKLDARKFNVLCVTRIHPSKGSHLLRSLSEILPDDIRLIVAGRGEASDLNGLRNVELVGELPNEAVPYLMNSCDIAVNLTVFPGVGRFTYEAIACGKPVIRLMSGEGYPLIHMKNSILVRNVDETLKWIEKLRKSESLRRELSKNALRTRTAISVDTLAEEVDRVYEKTLEIS